MATVSKSITLAVGVKAVYAVFTGTEFYKAIGLKATVSAAVGGKYKINAMSGTVLSARKEQMIVRTLRDESMAKDIPDMVSVFTFAETKEKKETVLSVTIANVPEKLVDKIKDLLAERSKSLKAYLTAPKAEKKPAAKKSAAKKTAAPKAAKAAKKPAAKKVADKKPAAAKKPAAKKPVAKKAAAKKPAAKKPVAAKTPAASPVAEVKPVK